MQWPVCLFCIIYSSAQSVKDLKQLYKQNAVNKITKWTTGSRDISEDSERDPDTVVAGKRE